MIVERCGDENCIPIINNTDLDEYHQPTVHYNFDECGLSDNVQSLKSGKIQTKISAGVKDTLRPAEYPWLVCISINLSYTSFSNICKIGSYRKSFNNDCSNSNTL